MEGPENNSKGRGVLPTDVVHVGVRSWGGWPQKVTLKGREGGESKSQAQNRMEPSILGAEEQHTEGSLGASPGKGAHSTFKK